MANKFGISDLDERRIRARDKRCVYCHVKLKKSPSRHPDSATIEHFNNNGPFGKFYNIAMCCRACNSSKGTKKLLDWLDSPYCQKNGISQQTVARAAQEYLRTKTRSRSATVSP
jgi:hypothetical protein